MATDEKVSTCCDCGYQWPTGQDGSHSCAEQFRKLLNKQHEQYQHLSTQYATLHLEYLDKVKECDELKDKFDEFSKRASELADRLEKSLGKL